MAPPDLAEPPRRVRAQPRADRARGALRAGAPRARRASARRRGHAEPRRGRRAAGGRALDADADDPCDLGARLRRVSRGREAAVRLQPERKPSELPAARPQRRRSERAHVAEQPRPDDARARDVELPPAPGAPAVDAAGRADEPSDGDRARRVARQPRPVLDAARRRADDRGVEAPGGARPRPRGARRLRGLPPPVRPPRVADQGDRAEAVRRRGRRPDLLPVPADVHRRPRAREDVRGHTNRERTAARPDDAARVGADPHACDAAARRAGGDPHGTGLPLRADGAGRAVPVQVPRRRPREQPGRDVRAARVHGAELEPARQPRGRARGVQQVPARAQRARPEDRVRRQREAGRHDPADAVADVRRRHVGRAPDRPAGRAAVQAGTARGEGGRARDERARRRVVRHEAELPPALRRERVLGERSAGLPRRGRQPGDGLRRSGRPFGRARHAEPEGERALAPDRADRRRHRGRDDGAGGVQRRRLLRRR